MDPRLPHDYLVFTADNYCYNYINTEHVEIKKIIVIFSITLLCNGKVMHNVNSLLKIILMSKQILGQDTTAPGDADDAPSDRAFWRE